MTNRPPVPSTYRCPKCDGVGKPYYLKSDVGRVHLHFRCPYCEHKWKITKPDAQKR